MNQEFFVHAKVPVRGMDKFYELSEIVEREAHESYTQFLEETKKFLGLQAQQKCGTHLNPQKIVIVSLTPLP